MNLDFIIETLDKKHDKKNFDCGELSLNDFLQKYAGQNAKRGLGKTFVTVLPDDKKVCGYYNLSSGSVEFEDFHEKLPRYPIPTVHLGRLAVDNSMKGQGLGAILLIDALERTVKVADELGIYAVELYSLTENAKQFYLKFGFIELKDDKKHLYLPIATLRSSGLLN